MKKIIMLICLLMIAYSVFSQNIAKIQVIVTDTFKVTKPQLNKAVKAFIMIEGLDSLVQDREHKIELMEQKIVNQNWLIEQRTRQVADSSVKITKLELANKKLSSSNYLLKWTSVILGGVVIILAYIRT